MSANVKTYIPKNRIETLARRPGGISRKKALEDANAAVQALRDESITAIEEKIKAITDIVVGARSEVMSNSDMRRILQIADHIIVLAETYRCERLVNIAKGLCDLISNMVKAGRTDRNAIEACSRALKLVAPHSPRLSHLDEEILLTELERVSARFRIAQTH